MKSITHINNQSSTVNIQGRLIDLSTPQVMGILNVTPDSFYDGDRFTTDDTIVRQAEKMLSEGALIIDVGGYSSRPGAEDVPESEELKRSVGAIKLIAKNFPTAILSIDTFRSEVARAAIGEGAGMVNDISGGGLDVNMFSTVADLGVPCIVMHMRGTPQTMKGMTDYGNLIMEIAEDLQRKISLLNGMGVRDILIDPGFGFAKTIDQNFQLLSHLDYLKMLGKPIVAGLSRKSMIWKTLGTNPAGALNGTTALNMTALNKGANILRVHDVREAIEAVKLHTSLHGQG